MINIKTFESFDMRRDNCDRCVDLLTTQQQ